MIKLNLGCGSDIKQGFINIDIRELPGVNLVTNIENLDKYYTPESVDEINAYDVLEHFSFNKTVGVLTNWISKLKVGGKIIVRVPDLTKIFSRFLENQLPFFEAQRLLFGGQDYPSNFHCAGFSQEYLEGLLLGCGCREIVQIVRERDSHNVTLVAIK
jgi:predicted SAM-dependent methyltransferase